MSSEIDELHSILGHLGIKTMTDDELQKARISIIKYVLLSELTNDKSTK